MGSQPVSERPIPRWLSTSAAILSASFLLLKLAQPERSFRRETPTPSNEDMTRDGRDAVAPSEIPAAGWKDILLRVWGGISEDRVTALAAASTYFALLAIFPALAAVVAIYGLFSNPSDIANQLNNLQGVLPGGALTVVGDELRRIVSQSHGSLGFAMIAGLLIALWSANSGVKSLFDSLNQVYGERERRGFIKLNLISLAFTITSVAVLILAVAAIAALPIALNHLGLSDVAAVTIKLARWPLLLIIIALSLALLYRFGPSRRKPQWRWVTWGSALAAVLWLITSILFSWYAASFGSFNKTYGSLGAVIGFMIWIWVSIIVILLGAELDAQMEHQTTPRHDGSPRKIHGTARCVNG